MSRNFLHLDEHPLFSERLPEIRLLYTDLDGTLLGKGGSLLVGADSRPSLTAAEAIVRINSANLEVVVCSGRNRIQIAEIARLCGWRGFIAELGCVIVADRGTEPVYCTGSWEQGDLREDETPFQAIERAGALEALFSAFPGKIENHAPYHLNREATHLLRGSIDVFEAAEVLAEIDLPIDIVDNGIIHPIATTLVDVEEVHAYHLIPSGVTKALAIELDSARRELDPMTAMSVGDSVTDAEMADVLGLGVIVANGLRDTSVREATAKRDNIAVTRKERGDGWAEMVLAWLKAAGRG